MTAAYLKQLDRAGPDPGLALQIVFFDHIEIQDKRQPTIKIGELSRCTARLPIEM